MTKTRLDQLLVQKGLVSSRSQAESWIGLGKVTVDGKVALKSGQFVANHAVLKLTAKERYVSRAGFTDYALQHGAAKVIAVDVGTEQLHPQLRNNQRIELHEKTDIREFTTHETIDIVVIDVSFISLRDILPSVVAIAPTAQIIAMVKPQFEAGKAQINKGIIKNDAVRRQILKDFELWTKSTFKILDKRDSEVAGAKGNRERFYLLTSIR